MPALIFLIGLVMAGISIGFLFEMVYAFLFIGVGLMWGGYKAGMVAQVASVTKHFESQRRF